MNHVFTEEINKTALNDKRMQSIHSVETYAHGMNKELVWKKEKIKRNSIIKR